MAKSIEEALGALYAWDATICTMFARGVDHPEFEEDEPVEAYEEMIQVAAQADGAHDGELGLAVQLLAKHFFKFQHVQMNVVDALVALVEPTHSAAVRVHTAYALLHIARNAQGTSATLSRDCWDKMAEAAQKLLENEASVVMEKALTELLDELASVDQDEKKDDISEEKHEKQRYDDSKDREQLIEEKKREAEEKRIEREKWREEQEREEEKRREREKRFDLKKSDGDDDDRKRKHYDADDKYSKRTKYDENDSRRDNRDYDRRPSYQSEGNNERRPQTNTSVCPPSTYIFVGGVPLEATHTDIVNYLSCIDESLTTQCVQIKHPPGARAAGYAFVCLETTDLARKAIRHVQTTEFDGRKLVGAFARGPPCGVLRFVERNPAVSMHDQGAVHDLDINHLDKGIWDELCDELERFGSMEIHRNGTIRFRDVESAKSVIRKHTFYIQGREILPIYDPEEQAEVDSSRRRARNNHDGDDSSRRMSKYGSSDAADRDGDRQSRRGSFADRSQHRRSVSPHDRTERTSRVERTKERERHSRSPRGRDDDRHQGERDHRRRSQSPRGRNYEQHQRDERYDNQEVRQRSQSPRGRHHPRDDHRQHHQGHYKDGESSGYRSSNRPQSTYQDSPVAPKFNRRFEQHKSDSRFNGPGPRDDDGNQRFFKHHRDSPATHRPKYRAMAGGNSRSPSPERGRETSISRRRVIDQQYERRDSRRDERSLSPKPSHGRDVGYQPRSQSPRAPSDRRYHNSGHEDSRSDRRINLNGDDHRVNLSDNWRRDQSDEKKYGERRGRERFEDKKYSKDGSRNEDYRRFEKRSDDNQPRESLSRDGSRRPRSTGRSPRRTDRSSSPRQGKGGNGSAFDDNDEVMVDYDEGDD